MTELLAAMLRIAALELPAATTGTDVFRFEVVARLTGRRAQGSRFASVCQTFTSLALPGAASLPTFVSTAVERNAAHTHTLRRLLVALMTNSSGCRAGTSTGDRYSLQTGETTVLMTRLFAMMTTIKGLIAGFGTISNRFFAG